MKNPQPGDRGFFHYAALMGPLGARSGRELLVKNGACLGGSAGEVNGGGGGLGGFRCGRAQPAFGGGLVLLGSNTGRDLVAEIEVELFIIDGGGVKGETALVRPGQVVGEGAVIGEIGADLAAGADAGDIHGVQGIVEIDQHGTALHAGRVAVGFLHHQPFSGRQVGRHHDGTLEQHYSDILAFGGDARLVDHLDARIGHEQDLGSIRKGDGGMRDDGQFGGGGDDRYGQGWRKRSICGVEHAAAHQGQ